jgi:hypothetical protein
MVFVRGRLVGTPVVCAIYSLVGHNVHAVSRGQDLALWLVGTTYLGFNLGHLRPAEYTL